MQHGGCNLLRDWFCLPGLTFSGKFCYLWKPIAFLVKTSKKPLQYPLVRDDYQDCHNTFVYYQLTCQQFDGDFLSRMYCVSGDGSSSYLSNGKLSRTKGSELLHEKNTLGWASREGWKEKNKSFGNLLSYWICSLVKRKVQLTVSIQNTEDLCLSSD